MVEGTGVLRKLRPELKEFVYNDLDSSLTEVQAKQVCEGLMGERKAHLVASVEKVGEREVFFLRALILLTVLPVAACHVA